MAGERRRAYLGFQNAGGIELEAGVGDHEILKTQILRTREFWKTMAIGMSPVMASAIILAWVTFQHW